MRTTDNCHWSRAVVGLLMIAKAEKQIMCCTLCLSVISCLWLFQFITTAHQEDPLSAAARLANLHRNKFVLLACSHAATIICLYLDNFHGRHWAKGSGGGKAWQFLIGHHAREPATSIYWNTLDIAGWTRISGTNVQQLRVNNTYIHTHNYSPCMGRCHDQCGACSSSPQLSRRIIVVTI